MQEQTNYSMTLSEGQLKIIIFIIGPLPVEEFFEIFKK